MGNIVVHIQAKYEKDRLKSRSLFHLKRLGGRRTDDDGRRSRHQISSADYISSKANKRESDGCDAAVPLLYSTMGCLLGIMITKTAVFSSTIQRKMICSGNYIQLHMFSFTEIHLNVVPGTSHGWWKTAKTTMKSKQKPNRPISQIPECICAIPTMHHFVTEMCTCVHISVTKWCIVGYLSGALWDLWDGSITMLCHILTL